MGNVCFKCWCEIEFRIVKSWEEVSFKSSATTPIQLAWSKFSTCHTFPTSFLTFKIVQIDQIFQPAILFQQIFKYKYSDIFAYWQYSLLSGIIDIGVKI